MLGVMNCGTGGLGVIFFLGGGAVAVLMENFHTIFWRARARLMCYWGTDLFCFVCFFWGGARSRPLF